MKVDGQKMMVRIMNGLKPKIRADLIRHNPTTMEELRTQASLAEFAQSNRRPECNECHRVQCRQLSGGTDATCRDKQHEHGEYG